MERDLNGTAHSMPVLAFSQLPYDVEKRDDQRRQLAALSGVGTIELDVDVIWLSVLAQFMLCAIHECMFHQEYSFQP